MLIEPAGVAAILLCIRVDVVVIYKYQWTFDLVLCFPHIGVRWTRLLPHLSLSFAAIRGYSQMTASSPRFFVT